MAKCLVTGGAGFVGSHLVEALVAAGHGVRVLDDFSTGNPDNLRAVRERIELVTGSITDPAAIRQAVQGRDWVFHLAALASVQKSIEDPLASHAICATGTLSVLQAAQRADVRRLVYAASSSAYGDQEGSIRKEDDPLYPLSPYAAAKLAGEHYCSSFTAAYGMETVRLRFFNIFGPRQDARSYYSGVIALFIAAALEGRPLTVHGDGQQSRDFVYVANAVQALMRAAEARGASGGVYNIGNGASTTLLDLVKHLSHVVGRPIHTIHGPTRAGDVRHSQADITRARRDIGYEPCGSFGEGLRRTFEAYRPIARPSK